MLRDLLPPAVVAAVILLLTTIRIEGPQTAPASASLAVHLAMFAVLAAALGWSWRQRGWPRPVLAPLIVAVAYGIAIEGVQLLVLPHRSGELPDVLADAVGAVLGALTAHRLVPGGTPARRPDAGPAGVRSRRG